MHTDQPPPDATPMLFEVPTAPAADVPSGAPAPRLREVNRAQLEWRPVDLEALLADDHPARIVWEYVAGLDLTAVYAQIQAVDGLDVAVVLAQSAAGDRGSTGVHGGGILAGEGKETSQVSALEASKEALPTESWDLEVEPGARTTFRLSPCA